MRVKEEESDYRYFPEPDVPPMALPPQQLQSWVGELIELPAHKRARYLWLGLGLRLLPSRVT